MRRVAVTAPKDNQLRGRRRFARSLAASGLINWGLGHMVGCLAEGLHLWIKATPRLYCV